MTRIASFVILIMTATVAAAWALEGPQTQPAATGEGAAARAAEKPKIDPPPPKVEVDPEPPGTNQGMRTKVSFKWLKEGGTGEQQPKFLTACGASGKPEINDRLVKKVKEFKAYDVADADKEMVDIKKLEFVMMDASGTVHTVTIEKVGANLRWRCNLNPCTGKPLDDLELPKELNEEMLRITALPAGGPPSFTPGKAHFLLDE